MSGNEEYIQALNDFLSDADLQRLETLTAEVNFFDVLKITRMEIRHSNMLAWLLDPNENHGLGDKVLKGFITRAAQYKQDDSFDPSAVDRIDYGSFSLFREWCYIDILAVSQNDRFVLCIENKIDSGEHGNQLELYADRVNQTYRDYQKLFVYLSPDGRESSDTGRWLSMSYEDVVNVIEDALSDSAISAEAKLIIDNYLKTVRRDIMGSDETAKLCTEIYQKHKKAIDLIIEHLPDTKVIIRDIVFQWAQDKAREGTILFDRKYSADRFIRFQTETMRRIMPDSEDTFSAWGTHSYYYYEIVNVSGYELSMQLAINSLDIPNDLRKTSDQIEKLYPSPRRSKKWNYRYPKRTGSVELPDDLSETIIRGILDDMLREILTFEKELEMKLQNQR